MDFDPESVKNQQTEPLGASFSNARPPNIHHPYPYNFGIALPGFFVPFSSTMYPNSAVEQLVPSGFRASFPRGVCEDWTGHETLGAASSQIQDLQLSANSEPDFDYAPQATTRALYVSPGQQDWPYDTAAHYTSPNGLDLPQAGTVAHTFSDAHSHYTSTEQQNWYDEPATHDNMANGFDSAWQDNTAYDAFMNGFDQDASTNLLHSNGTLEANHISGNDIVDTQLSSISCNTETNFSFNAPSQVSTPTPSPTDATSPNSTRHPCPHPHCLSTFARLGDLSRHAKTHSPERHRKYHCREPGCDRNGRKGFTRRDKLRDHVRRVHGLDEDGVVSESQVEAGWN
jgi:hypothetical protein